MRSPRVEFTNRFALRHLQIARQFIEEDQNRLVAECSNPLIDAGCPGAVAPERRHHLALTEPLPDEPPQEARRILMAIENNNLRDTELGSGAYPRDLLAAQVRVRREQPEGYEAVRLTSTHRLGQIEGPVVAAPGKPFEAPLD